MFLKLSVLITLWVIYVHGIIGERSCQYGPSHNFHFGKREVYHELLFEDELDVRGLWFLKRSAQVTYPSEEGSSEGYIYYMELIDRFPEGDGACVSVKSGGIGYNQTTVYIESQRSHGIRFNVSIYGMTKILPLSPDTAVLRN